MIHCSEFDKYISKNIVGKRNKVDNTVYSFDIETTSYLVLNGKQIPAIDYLKLTDEERSSCEFKSNMYIWMFSINDVVYYGRTWDEFKTFLLRIDTYSPHKKIVFIHNLAFEFQYLHSIFNFKSVIARKSHKVMKAVLEDYNIELRCSYLMSNCALKYLPKLFNLPVEKKVGDLDYTLIRTSVTSLTEKELGYCEYDCLVIYHYILKELETYERVDKIPMTSTGHVRRELKERTQKDWTYKNATRSAINTNPHVYNMLMDAFAGGYTHANYIYTDEIIKDVTSYDFTSSYPYVLVTHRYPMTEFKQCYVKNVEEFINSFAYLCLVKFNNIRCKYFNNFISQSKCRNIKGASYDNGRIIQAETLEMTCTDVDLKFFLDTYEVESYEIIESWYSIYKYLPKSFIEFILEKYVNKTQFKNVEGKEVEYTKEKNKFNSLYGMSVTNMIKDAVEYDNESGWSEIPMTNEEIVEALEKDKKKAFLSFSWGVWVTAYARNNLLRNMIKLDEFCLYADTDSLKLRKGFDKSVIDNYNKFVERKIEHVSQILNIPIEKFAPKDAKGISHMLGLFDNDGIYEEFITQGAKKYAVITNEKLKDVVDKEGKTKDNVNIIEIKDDTAKCIEITVAGVPKSGCKAIKNLNEFKDDFVFEYQYTNKNLLMYCEDMEDFDLTDYQGNITRVTDRSGCCVVPTTYVLGKALEYCELISDNSSARSRYIE